MRLRAAQQFLEPVLEPLIRRVVSSYLIYLFYNDEIDMTHFKVFPEHELGLIFLNSVKPGYPIFGD